MKTRSTNGWLVNEPILTSGPDGYKSLLIEEEGGKAIELVSEENGILISMLLRQYFMSLKVLDRWTHMSTSMSSHWAKVVSKVAKYHPILPAKKPTPSPSPAEATGAGHSLTSSWARWSPAQLRARRSSVGPLSERETDVDRDSPPSASTPERELSGIKEVEDDERELRIMRKVIRRWCRKAGFHAEVDGDVGEEGVHCDWTKAIAPKVEGRIIMVEDGS